MDYSRTSNRAGVRPYVLNDRIDSVIKKNPGERSEVQL